MTTFLALDLGWNTGWAVGREKGPIRFGTFNTPAEPTEFLDVRFAHWLAWLRGLTTLVKPDAIYYEQAFQRSQQAARIYGGLQALLMTHALSLNLQAVPVHSATIKLSTTGNGRASKAEMIRVARETIGTDEPTLDDNAADAIGLLRHAQQCVKTLEDSRLPINA